jgi:ankyrin repeat protein
MKAVGMLRLLVQIVTVVFVAFGSTIINAHAQQQSPQPNYLPPQELFGILRQQPEEAAIEALGRSTASLAQLNGYSVNNRYTLLRFAVMRDARLFTEALLKHGVNPNNASPHTTALHVAAHFGRYEIARILIEHGANVDGVDANGDTPLTTAVERNRREIAQLLIESGADLKKPNKFGETPLAFAARTNARAVVEHAMAAGHSPDQRVGPSERPLLVWAAEGGAAGTAEVLINAGASVDHETTLGIAPIHAAAATPGAANCLRVLLRAGASPNHPHGKTAWQPLHFAAAAGVTENIEALLTDGAAIDAANAAGHTPLHVAVMTQNHETVVQLIDAGADLVVQDAEGRTPMHWALLLGDTQTAQEIASAGPDLAAADRYGENVADLARRIRAPWMRDVFIAMGVEIDEKRVRFQSPATDSLIAAIQANDNNRARRMLEGVSDINESEATTGWTPLHYAVAELNREMVESLLERAADPNRPDSAGRTPLHIAAIVRARPIFDLLVNNGGDPARTDRNGIRADNFFDIDPGAVPPTRYFGYVEEPALATPARQ